ncbi:MAG TPA: M20 family metallopeptidase [Candidatus Binataceae bacterium]|nr:M20 family metallopeptidase [Candidatus Binataceae bacterium]
MSKAEIAGYVERAWKESILSELTEYIRIPNKSPAFDREWRTHGHIDRVAERFADWARRQPIRGMQVEIVRLENRTPLIFIDIPGAGGDTVLLYGHMDKQPEMTGWREGLSPWNPVIEGDRLYGRGASDDGYAIFACLSAIGALEAANIPHARCVVIIESCEESGSFDLPHYIEHLAERIGRPSLVIALDSGCGDYERLWCTTSLRGLAGGVLKVAVLTEGVHSGGAGGIVPESFRIARMLLSRIENERTGKILGREFYAPIPAARKREAKQAAKILGRAFGKLPFAGTTKPLAASPAELILNRTWRPALAIIGAEGIPPAANAGNVLRPSTTLSLSLRLPPTADAKAASRKLKLAIEKNPPYGARVAFKGNWSAQGWNAPALAPWLEKSLDAASRGCFGRPAAYMGEGGTIPFMAMLGERFPKAQFLITGVLGPGSNAHGANEFLHIPAAKKLTCCVAGVIADHASRKSD